MKFPAAALTIACALTALPGTARAKGGGHGGGGHSGHSGHASHGSSASGHHRSAQSHATARGRTHIGQPGAGTAVPRPAPLPLPGFPVGGGLAPLPAHPLFGLNAGFGLFYAGTPATYTDDTGALRLDVEPASAEVIVDGYFAGVVDDFSGRRHHLDLAPGPHHIEVLAPGYQPLAFDLLIQPHHTTRFAATLALSAP